jgi:hypothetical protein
MRSDVRAACPPDASIRSPLIPGSAVQGHRRPSVLVQQICCTIRRGGSSVTQAGDDTPVQDWLHALRSGHPVTRRLVAEAIDRLLDDGPALGRPLADRVSGSRLHNLKELRPGSSGTTEVRILFIFDPARNAVLLVAGDKSGRWDQWYRDAIPAAETAYEAYLKGRGQR